MKALRFAALVLMALALGGMLAAPIGPVPGFFIGGKATDAPEQWEDTSGVDEILLKVSGTPPRVVILWVIQHGGELHVVGRKDSGWAKMIGNGSPVELRIGDRTYSLQASPVVEEWQPVVEAYVDKYRPNYPDIVAGFPSIEEAEGVIAVFRLNRI